MIITIYNDLTQRYNDFTQRVEKLADEHKFSQAQNESKNILFILDLLYFIVSYEVARICFSFSLKSLFSVITLLALNENPDIWRPETEPPLNGSPHSPVRSPLAPLRSVYIHFQRFELADTISTILVLGLATIMYPFSNYFDYSLYSIFVDNFSVFVRSFFYYCIRSNLNVSIRSLEAKTERLYKQPRMNAFIKRLQHESPSNMEIFKSILTDHIFTYDLMIDPVVASNGRVYERESIIEWMNKLKAENNLITAPENRAEITTTLIEAEAIEVLISELEENPTMDLSNSKALKDENNVKFITPYIDLKTGKTVEASTNNAKSNPGRYQRFFLLEELTTQVSQNISKPKL